MRCPSIASSFVIADDARLAAQLSCRLAKADTYLPVVGGPLLFRGDGGGEVARRNNSASRANAKSMLFVGLQQESQDALLAGLWPQFRAVVQRISTAEDVQQIGGRCSHRPPLVWGKDRIGVGLLMALRANRPIKFTDEPSTPGFVKSQSGHLVVCEEGDDICQVIAANYAYALRAGLCLIPEASLATSEAIIEALYAIYDDPNKAPKQVLEALRDRLRGMSEGLPLPTSGSLTFVTARLPFGLGYPELPSTHLFRYPTLGLDVVNAFAAERPGTRGISVAALVDPDTVTAPEIESAERLLAPRGAFLRIHSGPNANVRAITEMAELFPYDLLLIATHCGDASGYRWTYEFTDSEGRDRTLVVDKAVAAMRTDDEDLVHVTEFNRFVSLDGVDWNDPDKSKKLYIGSAINDFTKLTSIHASEPLEPVARGTVDRVLWSAALKMYDGNYIPMPKSFADEGTPIVINNACSSWRRLAETFSAGGARAYVGTLIAVTTSEAGAVIEGLLGRHYGKPLPTALWATQNEVYGTAPRRPYVCTGAYPQTLRTNPHDVPRHIVSRLLRARADWRRVLTNEPASNVQKVRYVKAGVDYYDREIRTFRENWPNAFDGLSDGA